MGNLTRDVELKNTPSNQQVATLGLAVNRRWRTPEGEDREETTFVDCEAWGRTAETLSKYLSKGRPVFIEGRLKLDQWEDKEGKKQSKIRVGRRGLPVHRRPPLRRERRWRRRRRPRPLERLRCPGPRQPRRRLARRGERGRHPVLIASLAIEARQREAGRVGSAAGGTGAFTSCTQRKPTCDMPVSGVQPMRADGR